MIQNPLTRIFSLRAETELNFPLGPNLGRSGTTRLDNSMVVNGLVTDLLHTLLITHFSKIGSEVT